ncbi:MAG: DUF5677 domain-containing protein [Elusimicrobiota bacterium]|nr:DUF5677 domain-containing protein [Elusimicrobiota bacterium]
MKELILVVGRAKVRVDAGFSKVGRGFKDPSPADRAALVLAARAVSGANALSALCERGHANEALPLLRAVAEWSLALRWVCAADSDARAQAAFAELDAAWDGVWPSSRLRERAEAFGVPAGALASALDSAPFFSRGNAQGLPWGHAAASSCLPGKSPAELLSACAVFLGHALAALDGRWPGEFPGAEEMWAGAVNSRGQS